MFNTRVHTAHPQDAAGSIRSGAAGRRLPRTLTFLVAILACLAAGTAAAQGLDDVLVEKFVQRMATKHDYDAAALRVLFAQANRQDAVLKAISKPAEYKPWSEYRPIFLTPERIQAGVAFWRGQSAALERATQTYGVPAEIIVAIIGVETFYGRNTGSYRVLDALSTLAFNYPPRATFFTDELENFLLLARDEGVDPRTPTGSYAGAMGFPQFMPSSFRRFAVDFDADGHRNIWTDREDAIGSVANYLKEHGWEANRPVVLPAVASPAAEKLAADVEVPKRLLTEYVSSGVKPAAVVSDASVPAMLLALDAEDGNEYWFGFRNFYAITRYNHSPKYAMAVTQLAQAIKLARGSDPRL
ncbi:MAG: lytic murein transglycosylase B [Gammaproteobacteria bacterium]|nr:lytic murein transglycosylase B [Gammaproteobacteria bacterium]